MGSWRTLNFINIVERVPYAPTGTMEVGPGQYYPAPEKYRDWALPNNGVELYYAHTKAMAQFFGWYKTVSEKTNQLNEVFGKNSLLDPLHADVKAAGPYNAKARDEFISKGLQGPLAGAAAGAAFPQATAMGFLEIAVEFAINSCPQAFEKELIAKPYIDKLTAEAKEMSFYLGDMNMYMSAIPEFATLCHPNAQVDNAFYWRDDAGEVKCGLLDWGGIFFGNIPTCLGNGWMGAEPEVFAEHEEKLLQLFVDEYEKCAGFRFDVDDLYLNVKLAQCVVFYGCCANIGMCLRLHKRDEWATMTGRKDPRIDENFLLRCYFVQVYLWFKMWGLSNAPYRFFQQWKQRLNMPNKAS